MGKILWKLCRILKKLWGFLKIFSVNFRPDDQRVQVFEKLEFRKILKAFGRIFRRNGKKKLCKFLLNYGENFMKLLQNLEEIVRMFEKFLSKFLARLPKSTSFREIKI